MEMLYTSQEKVMVPIGKLTEVHILKVKEQSKFGQVNDFIFLMIGVLIKSPWLTMHLNVKRNQLYIYPEK